MVYSMIGGESALKSSILIAVPCVRKNIRAETVQSFMSMALTTNYIGGLVIKNEVPHDVCRAQIADYFLTQTKCSWLFSCDDDVIPPSNILDMWKDAMENGRKLVSCDVNQLENGQVRPVCFKRGATGFVRVKVKKNTPMKVDAFGTGCYFAHRSVFEKVPSPWYHFIKNETGKKLKYGEDLVFTHAAKNQGIQPWYDTRFKAGHVKERVI